MTATHELKRPVLLYTSLVLVAFVLAGHFLEPVAATDDSYRYLSNFSDTLDLVEKNYVEPTDLANLMAGAYRGLLEELDPDSYFLPPADARRARAAEAADPRVGIGVELSKRHGYAVVLTVLPGSPAAGKIGEGDYIRLIDGLSTREMSLRDCRDKLLGAAGSEVVLKVLRRDDFDTAELKLPRAALAPPAMASEQLADGLLRLTLPRLDDETVAQATGVLRGSSGLSGVILDLRGSSIGPSPAGARLADLFLDSGTVLRVAGKVNETAVKRSLAGLAARRQEPPAAAGTGTDKAPGDRFEYRVEASPDDTLWRGPLAVLTDNGTAGAGELAAAALAAGGRASVIGARTCGRGGLQDLVPLDDGAALHLTVAHFLSPAGESLLGPGVTPADEVETRVKDGKDLALERAIERLRADGREKKAA